jgi:hypothetical protein
MLIVHIVPLVLQDVSCCTNTLLATCLSESLICSVKGRITAYIEIVLAWYVVNFMHVVHFIACSTFHCM